MKVKKYLVMVIFATLLVLVGCSSDSSQSNGGSGSTSKDGTSESSDSERDQILYFAIGDDPKNLDGHFHGSLPQYAPGINMFNGLVRFPPGTVDVETIEGDIAETWEHNEDASVWTFKIREGVKWHKDYGEVTPEEVKASFERVMNPENGITSRADFINVDSIEVTEGNHLVFNLIKPDPNFLLKVVNFAGGNIVNVKAIEEDGEVIGTGPFMLEEYNTQDSVVLVKHKEYFRGEPKLDKIVYKIMSDQTAIDTALEKGEIHISLGSADPVWRDKMLQIPDLLIETTQPMAQGNIYLKTTEPPFDDIRVRQAVAHAINVDAYVQAVVSTDIGGRPTGPIPSDVSGSIYSPQHEYDLEKAKQLLTEAGYPDGLTLEPQYVSPASHILNPMTFIQDQLKNVGIEMPLEQIDHATFQQNMRKGLNQLSYVAFNRKPHISVWLHDVFYGPSSTGTPTGIINYSHYNKSDDLIEQVLLEVDVESAMEIYEQIQKEIMEEFVAIPLVEYPSTVVRRKEVNLGYNDNKHVGSLGYYYMLTEETFLE